MIIKKESLIFTIHSPVISMSNFSVLAMILAVFTSGHVVTTDVLGLRMEFQALLFLVILICSAGLIQKKLSKLDLAILCLVLSFIFGEILFRGELYEVVGHLLTFALAFIALATNRNALIKFVDLLNNFNVLMSILAFVGFFIAINNIDILLRMMERPALYSQQKLNGQTVYLLLGNIDTQNFLFGLELPRINGYVQQASLVPAYFLLPLGLAMAFSRVSRTKIIILLLFMILTLGGNVIVALFSAYMLYVFRRFIPSIIYINFPFFILGLLTVVLMIFYFDEVIRIGISGDELEVLGGVGENLERPNALEGRASSGLVRLIILAKQFGSVLQAGFLPATPEIMKYSLGSSIYTNALLGGGVALILTIVLYLEIFKISIKGFRDKKRTNTSQFGYCLIYATLFQAMVYNDYGFSTYYALMIFCIIIKLSRNHDRSDSISA